MPEYLAPGVYVEEVSFRAKTIEGVSTSTAGFIGPTRYGPTEGEPELLTSFADFERIYGGLDSLVFNGETQINFMAHAVRAFFDNGGSRLYVTRVYEPTNTNDEHSGKASYVIGSPERLRLRARFPGQAGNMRIVFAVKMTPNLLVADSNDPTRAPQVRGVRENDVVFIKAGITGSTPMLSPGSSLEGLYDVVREDGGLAFDNPSSGRVRLSDLNPSQYRVHLITITVRVLRPGRFDDEEVWEGLSPHPSNRRNALASYFTDNTDNPLPRSRYLTVPFAIVPSATLTSGVELLEGLLEGSDVLDAVSRSLYTDDELELFSPPEERPPSIELERPYTLDGGSDGRLPSANSYKGRDTGLQKTGLETFADVEEISIVAAPGYSANYRSNPQRGDQITQDLLMHCYRMRYRIAVVDSPDGQIVSQVRDFRGKFDSKHAALYYPWVRILDPLDPDGRREINLPPSGFVVGIYARNDVEKGVHKAPANEVVLGAIGFEILLNKAQQDILNPEGINCFRFFEGRGYRLWGARTITSDPEWKYVNLRRYFAFLERSIEKGTQWAVFENNSEPLWANIRRTVEDFLFNEWKSDHLMGEKPQEAYFVRCDRSTMTQNDIDNGRLICLIGVAPVRPAEFVIFRIGQWTADRRS